MFFGVIEYNNKKVIKIKTVIIIEFYRKSWSYDKNLYSNRNNKTKIFHSNGNYGV